MVINERQNKKSQIKSIIEKYNNPSESLIAILQEVQALVGYISEESVKCITELTGITQEDYDNVCISEDNVFSRYAAKARREKPEQSSADAVEDIGFYTETLAQIYAEQGYYSQAKKIYSKLILAYPEKSAYFASLIRKIEEIN